MRQVILVMMLLAPAAPARGAGDGPVSPVHAQLPATQPLGVSVRTSHYDLYLEKLDPHDTATLLEAYYPQLVKVFGGSLDLPLRVEVYGSKDRFDQALSRDVQDQVNAGGFYSSATRKAYLFVQPSEYFTRHLLLHETAHQFHFLFATRNLPPHLLLYTEGVAEDLAMHNWDGHELAIETIPAITLEDYPKQALEQFTSAHEDFEGLLSGTVKCDRPLDWAIVHFLRERHPQAFKNWSHRLDLGEEPAPAAHAAFAESISKMRQEFLPWLKTHQQPWTIEARSWQQRGGAIEGSSPDNTVAVALPKHSAQKLTVELWPEQKNFLAGLTINYKSRGDYELLQVMTNHHVRLLRLAGGNWIREGDWPMPPQLEGKGCDVLMAVKTGKSIELRVNGQPIKSVPADGDIGLHVQQGRVRFVMH